MLFAFALHLVHRLFKQNLQLSLAAQLLVVLLPSNLEQSAFVLHRFLQFLHDAVIALQLLLFSLLLARGVVVKGALRLHV